MSDVAVADAVWDILKRPHQRTRWERWTRAGATKHRASDDRTGGAQNCVAWVVEAYLDGERAAREAWSVPNSAPRRRSAIQRFFSQGAGRRLHVRPGRQSIEQLTRSRALIDIVNAFEFTEAEVAEIRAAWSMSPPAESWHMGRCHHTWDTARSDEDLRGVTELSRRFIGGLAGFKDPGEPPTEDDIAPLRRRLDLRADALELCLRQDLEENHEILVGYLLAYPLDASATAGILAGRITGADQLEDSQVAVTFASEESLYIGMVLGADLSARVSVMEHCIQRVTKWMGAHPDGCVFAKRSTDDGERWLRSYDFVPVVDQESIWMRDPSLPAASRRKRRLIATAA